MPTTYVASCINITVLYMGKNKNSTRFVNIVHCLITTKTCIFIHNHNYSFINVYMYKMVGRFIRVGNSLFRSKSLFLKRDCEQITLVTLYKRVMLANRSCRSLKMSNVSDSLMIRSFTLKNQGGHRVLFCSEPSVL